MEKHNKFVHGCTALVAAAIVGGLVVQASATPAVNSAVQELRIFNDDPDSVATFGDTYPANIFIQDTLLDGDGDGGEFANLHIWRFSENNFTEAVFNNGDPFSFSADLTISGTGNGEAGLQISPWWSQDVDGRFNLRTGDGEIAVFGGRLPFYSFTNAHGVTYNKGDTVRVGMSYDPNGLSMADPATVEYTLTLGGNDYSSGPLAFDEGNPAEDPPHGLWGMLNDARAGGYVQPLIDVGNSENGLRADWGNISFVPEPSSMALLILGGLAVLRPARRR
jgi:hypothetical protein